MTWMTKHFAQRWVVETVLVGNKHYKKLLLVFIEKQSVSEWKKRQGGQMKDREKRGDERNIKKKNEKLIRKNERKKERRIKGRRKIKEVAKKKERKKNKKGKKDKRKKERK